jgi:ABC-type transporter Mla subunit MlaD
MNTRSYISLLVGSAVLVLLAGVLAVKVSDTPFSPKLTFQVAFDDVRELRERAKVSYLGLPAGSVKHLEVEQGAHNRPYVVATLEVPKGLKLPRNVDVRITPTILGETYVAITLPEGDVDPRTIAQHERLKTKGQIATRLDSLFPGFDEKMAALDAKLAASESNLENLEPDLKILDQLADMTIKGLGATFVEKGPDGKTRFDAYSDAVAKFTFEWQGNDPEGLKKSLRETMGDLHDLSQEFDEFMKPENGERPKLSTTLHKLNALMDQSKKVAGKLDLAADGLSKLKETDKSARDAFDAVQKAAEHISAVQPSGVGKMFLKVGATPAPTPNPAAKPGKAR